MRLCPSEEEVLAFAMGRLATARLPDLHQHLDQCETCQQLLSEAAHALATANTVPLEGAEANAWNTTFRPGTVVGQRYLIRRYVARGGMGEVYEAFDGDLQARVALKTVASTASDSQRAVRALKAEVQLARRVSHPNVCRIYDFGTHVMSGTGTQISFLTMEFVDGETLGQRVRLGGALPPRLAHEIARQLLLGLSAAHDAGVLHRDLKSDNVMLRSDPGGQVSAVIMDFGLAVALDRDSLIGGSSSNPALLGTLGYIAPEQFEGKTHSKASDVYAFGIVWFEMLTGESPFASSSSPTLALLERLKRDAPAPSTRNPQVSKRLDALIRGCLRRSPKDRHRTAGEVLVALDHSEKAEVARKFGSVSRALVALAFASVAASYLTLGSRRPGPLGGAPPSSTPARFHANPTPVQTRVTVRAPSEPAPRAESLLRGPTSAPLPSQGSSVSKRSPAALTRSKSAGASAAPSFAPPLPLPPPADPFENPFLAHPPLVDSHDAGTHGS